MKKLEILYEGMQGGTSYVTIILISVLIIQNVFIHTRHYKAPYVDLGMFSKYGKGFDIQWLFQIFDKHKQDKFVPILVDLDGTSF